MTTIRPTTQKPIPVIRGGEVGLCLTRIHHNRFTDMVREPDPVRVRLADRGIMFETEVIEEIRATHPGSFTVVPEEPGDPYTVTRTSLSDGVDVIVGGRIRSNDGSLVGAPDLLIRTDLGYTAIEVKGHKVLSEDGITVSRSALDNLTNVMVSDTTGFRSFRKRDLLQVAHYWRILDSLGVADPTGVGGVIGTDEPLGCAWVDLKSEDSPFIEDARSWTESASNVIAFGAEHPDIPLEAPWWRGECRSCEWNRLCHEQLKRADDPTLIKGIGLAEREVLAESGITTGRAIAALDPDDERIGKPWIVFDARAKSAGYLMRSDVSDDGVSIPSATREIDFDIETYQGRIYLAGFLETEEGQSRFDPVVDWIGTDETERIFVAEMFDRLATYSDDDTVVLHWSSYERDQLILAAQRHGLAITGFESVAEWFDQCSIDLYQWTKSTFVSPDGFGLKTVAPLCGFDWRDDDPGGLQSEIWYERMLAGEPGMRQRLLEYNEDDVTAQLAIRIWIRSQDSGRGPGSAIPSVQRWSASEV